VWQGRALAFGRTTEIVNAVSNPLRFPGQYADGETGLFYNYFRYYDPTVGRYITSDPIGLGGGVNNYLYSKNNPLVKIDVYGKLCLWQQRTGYYRCTDNDTGEVYAQTLPGETPYAGFGSCRNMPDCADLPFTGPLPKGCYVVISRQIHQGDKGIINKGSPGVYALELIPTDDVSGKYPPIEAMYEGDVVTTSTTTDRDGFWIHGYSGQNSYDGSSEGCPIMVKQNRDRIPVGELFCVY